MMEPKLIPVFRTESCESKEFTDTQVQAAVKSGELPKAGINTVKILSGIKCFGAFRGDCRNLTINLVMIDGDRQPAFEVSAEKGKRPYVPAVERVPVEISEGLTLIAESCAPNLPVPQSEGGKVIPFQDSDLNPRYYLPQFNPAGRVESIYDLTKLDLRIMIAEDPYIINIGKDRDGASLTLHPARFIFENDTESFGFVLRKTYIIDNQKFFDESKLKIHEAAEYIKNCAQAQF